MLKGHLIVLALDPPFGPSGEYSLEEIVSETCNAVAGYKVGLPLVLERGLGVLEEVKKLCDQRLIVDFKLADIGDIASRVVEKVASKGASAVIVHGFVGVEEALDRVVETAGRLGVDVITVASMSHPGSAMFIDKHFDELLMMSLNLGVHGVVVAATKPQLVNRARRIAGSRLRIYSPGIGVQGAEPGAALCAGADYEIVGRLVTRSKSPRKAVEDVLAKQAERLRTCRG